MNNDMKTLNMDLGIFHVNSDFGTYVPQFAIQKIYLYTGSIVYILHELCLEIFGQMIDNYCSPREQHKLQTMYLKIKFFMINNLIMYLILLYFLKPLSLPRGPLN